MLKRGLAFALALVMLASVSVAGATGMEIEKNGQWYTEVSAWAKDGVEKAIDLGVAYWPSRGDAKTSISRCYFAEDAAAVVALAYGSDLAAYEGFRVLQLMRGTGDKQKYAYETLDILRGRGNGDMDFFGNITRQEAAVMLARAYRIYCDEIHDDMEPLAYADKNDIADWAKEDVALITHLGVMNGIGENKFDPKGVYTLEQCFVTLVRLYEKTAQGKTPVGENPFPLTEREKVIGRTWRGAEVIDYVENDNIVAITLAGDNQSLRASNYYICVVDKNLKGAVYHNLIQKQYVVDMGGWDNYIEKDSLTVTEDGSKLSYQSILKEDVFVYDSTKEGDGDLLFAKGVYTVTLDVATGKQTYTRADLT